MGYIGIIPHLLTIDPNFQRDIQVQCSCNTKVLAPALSFEVSKAKV